MTRPARDVLTVVCYDIAHNRRRYRVAQILEGYGLRVQESVFECWLNPRTRRELQGRLDAIIDREADRVALYGLTEHAHNEAILLGSTTQLTENADVFIV